MNVMIVEDNAGMREVIKRLVTRQVQNVTGVFESADGADAVEQYKVRRPDWVLMDVAMKPVDGISATNSIRLMDRHAKIIMVTSFNDEQYRIAAFQAGALAYVLKENMSEIPRIIASYPAPEG